LQAKDLLAVSMLPAGTQVLRGKSRRSGWQARIADKTWIRRNKTRLNRGPFRPANLLRRRCPTLVAVL